MTQLYSVRSRASWDHGDLADLRELARWSAADLGAGFVLVNPLHAPRRARRWSPRRTCRSPGVSSARSTCGSRTSRSTPVSATRTADRSRHDRGHAAAAEHRRLAARPGRGLGGQARSAGTRARRAAQPCPAARRTSASVSCEGEGLRRLRDVVRAGRGPRCATGRPGRRSCATRASPAVAVARDEAGRPRRLLLLAAVAGRRAARRARRSRRPAPACRSGVVHDLAVGVHPHGADTWALQDVMARGVTVGAPPDAFNQQGQDWSQPPWRPDRLAEAGYAPYRDMLRTVLRHAGGVRVDHVLGLFRLWWVPEGAPPTEGTYVALRPRGADRHPGARGVAGRGARRRRGPRHVEPWVRDYLRRARRPRHVDPVVRAGLGRGRPAAAGELARAVPGRGDHARPAADRRLPRGRARRIRDGSAC